MKKYLPILVMVFTLFMNINVFSQDITSGTGWGELVPSESLVIDENFQGFEFFHSDENPDQGNSQHQMDESTAEIIYNYKDFDTTIVDEQSNLEYTYQFYQCAFAPDWSTSYAYQNETENTENVSDGFVEISREDEIYSQIPTERGYFTVDLTNLESVEIIRYTHSSTGGHSRGVMTEFSTDGGESWDTLRYQPGGGLYAESFTKDLFSGEKTHNNYRCDPSAYGMVWEDAIYWSYGDFMIRFRECGGQTPRIHDLKVFGTVASGTSVEHLADAIDIWVDGDYIRLSEAADLKVFSVNGTLVKSSGSTKSFRINDLVKGVYIIQASNNAKRKVEKIVIQ
jgi:hypothetical protein